MRNMLVALGSKALVLVAILAHWVLDDVVIFLPSIAVDAISKMLFKMTGNEYRFAEWQTFWNKKKPEEPIVKK